MIQENTIAVETGEEWTAEVGEDLTNGLFARRLVRLNKARRLYSMVH